METENREEKRGMRNEPRTEETARVYRPRTLTRRAEPAGNDAESAQPVRNENQTEQMEQNQEARQFERAQNDYRSERNEGYGQNSVQSYRPRTYRPHADADSASVNSEQTAGEHAQSTQQAQSQDEGFAWSEKPYVPVNQDDEDRPRRNFDRHDDRGNDRGYDRDRRPYGRSDDRGYDRDRRPYDRDRRDDRRDDRAFGRPRRPFDRRDDRSDDRGYDRQRRPYDRRDDDRGYSSERRSYDRSYDRPYDRRDDRGFDRDRRSFDRRDDRGYDRGYDRDRNYDRPRRPYERRDERDGDRGYDRPRRPYERRDDRSFDRRDGYSRNSRQSNFGPRRPDRDRRFDRDDRTFRTSTRNFDPKRNRKKIFDFSDENYNFDEKLPPITNVINEEDAAKGLIRLNKYIANSGVCSRREADEYIQNGQITVNGEVVTTLGSKVKREDEICLKGHRLIAERKVYILMNKPKDYVTTTDDPHAEHTVMDLLQGACEERIYPVGRLDRNTTGVLLFTNDGELTKRLTHPSFNKKKVYHVTLDRPVDENDLERIFRGMELDGEKIDVDAIDYVVGSDGSEVGIELHSGQNHVVKRLFEKLNYNVDKLDRVYFAGLTKKKLPRGQWRFLEPKEINMLKMGRF